MTLEPQGGFARSRIAYRTPFRNIFAQSVVPPYPYLSANIKRTPVRSGAILQEFFFALQESRIGAVLQQYSGLKGTVRKH